MKVLLTSLNAKYIHTNLAIRYIQSYCNSKLEDMDIIIKEFTINDHWDGILRKIYKENVDVIAFSCYIWNIDETIKIIQMLKKIQPNLKIVLGGPEVTFYGDDWMKRIEEIDYIIKDEGEVIFYELLTYLQSQKTNVQEIKGLFYRNGETIIENPARKPMDNLDDIPFPYPEDLSEYKDKIIYFESSRGCPFQCQYCLSSTTGGVRFFSMENVKKQLKIFIDAGVKQVKFVDRTFNCSKERTKDLLHFLIKEAGNTNFHFEVAADLIDDEILGLFQTAPTGLFQLEIGVQTTHEPTLKAIKRSNNFEQIKEVVKRIQAFDNIHQHVDLIAGLPYEGYERFKTSFNDVFKIKPDMLQLGFLKILKGSGIEIDKEKHHYKYTPFPPYEVLANDYISYEQIVQLKLIEDILERYSNSHVFDHTIEYLLKNCYKEPFDFFEGFSKYWEENDLYNQSHSQKTLYKIFLDFITAIEDNSVNPVLHELLKFDYLLTHKGPLPKFFKEEDIKNKKERSFEFLKNPENIERYLPDFMGLSPKEIYKYVHFEKFNIDILNRIDRNNSNKRENSIIIFYFPENQHGIFNKATYHNVEL